MLVVNGMFPGERIFLRCQKLMKGPLIEANEGDPIIVHVENNLDMPQSIRECPTLLKVDWHGMFQNGTGYMDGVPGFTQVSFL